LTGHEKKVSALGHASAEVSEELIIHDLYGRVAPEHNRLSIKNLAESLTASDHVRFALVRNPYKRIFSAWQPKLMLQDPLHFGAYKKYAFFNIPIRHLADIGFAFEQFLEYLATRSIYQNLKAPTQRRNFRARLTQSKCRKLDTGSMRHLLPQPL